MDCNGAQARLSAALDGELAQIEQDDVDTHLATCASCRAEFDRLGTLRRSVARVAARRAPLHLRHRVRETLRSETGHGVLREGRGAAWLDTFSAIRRPAALAASVIVLLLLSAASGYYVGTRGQDAALLRHDAVAAHIRSLLQDTQIQVASSDTHTVKPWFAGRVDAAPAVRDLSGDGFALLGGRVDYIGARRVGVLVYQQRRHIVTVYFWPSQGVDGMAGLAKQNGYNLLQWTASGISYLAISDLNAGDLQRLSQLL